MDESERDEIQNMDIGFRIVVNDFAYSDDQAIFGQIHGFALIKESKIYPGGIVAAMETWQSTEELEPILGAMIKKREAKQEAMKNKLPMSGSHEYVQQLMCDYPWMVQYMSFKEFGIEKTKRTSKRHGGGGDGTDTDDDDDDMHKQRHRQQNQQYYQQQIQQQISNNMSNNIINNINKISARTPATTSATQSATKSASNSTAKPGT